MELNQICVYCGSSDKIEPRYLQAADRMGRVLAKRGIGLVYGGGGTGMMGALASAVLEEGGQVIGVIPHFFDTPELVHNNLSQLHRVEDMHQRKAKMAQLADGFIAMPGGFGTFEELFEILTWAQIGLHNSPVGALNTDGYFDPMLTLIDHAQRNGFIYTEHRDLLSTNPDPVALLDTMRLYQPPTNLSRWVDRRKDDL